MHTTQTYPLEFLKLEVVKLFFIGRLKINTMHTTHSMYVWVVCIVAFFKFKLRIKDNCYQFLKIRVDTN